MNPMVWILPLVGLLGCGYTLPVPKTGPHQASEPFVIVPYPPPPAHVEVIPKPPKDTMVWLDGEWEWKRRRWQWVPGRWEVPPPGADYYAPSAVVRRGDESLVWFAGVWHKR